MIEIPPDTFARFSRATRRSIQELVHQESLVRQDVPARPMPHPIVRISPAPLARANVAFAAKPPIFGPSLPGLRARRQAAICPCMRATTSAATRPSVTQQSIGCAKCGRPFRSLGATEVQLQGRGCSLRSRTGPGQPANRASSASESWRNRGSTTVLEAPSPAVVSCSEEAARHLVRRHRQLHCVFDALSPAVSAPTLSARVAASLSGCFGSEHAAAWFFLITPVRPDPRRA
jgi:hypothetical protein